MRSSRAGLFLRFGLAVVLSFVAPSCGEDEPSGEAQCKASCAGKECGSDGCEGSCGTCADGFSCKQNQCEAEIPGSAPTLTALWSEVFSRRCSSCHRVKSEGDFNIGRNEDSFHAATVEVASSCEAKPYVVPGDADGSYLIHKLEGGPAICGKRMPGTGIPLQDGDIERIRDWIDAGAKND